LYLASGIFKLLDKNKKTDRKGGSHKEIISFTKFTTQTIFIYLANYFTTDRQNYFYLAKDYDFYLSFI